MVGAWGRRVVVGVAAGVVAAAVGFVLPAERAEASVLWSWGDQTAGTRDVGWGLAAPTAAGCWFKDSDSGGSNWISGDYDSGVVLSQSDCEAVYGDPGDPEASLLGARFNSGGTTTTTAGATTTTTAGTTTTTTVGTTTTTTGGSTTTTYPPVGTGPGGSQRYEAERLGDSGCWLSYGVIESASAGYVKECAIGPNDPPHSALAFPVDVPGAGTGAFGLVMCDGSQVAVGFAVWIDGVRVADGVQAQSGGECNKLDYVSGQIAAGHHTVVIDAVEQTVMAALYLDAVDVVGDGGAPGVTTTTTTAVGGTTTTVEGTTTTVVGGSTTTTVESFTDTDSGSGCFSWNPLSWFKGIPCVIRWAFVPPDGVGEQLAGLWSDAETRFPFSTVDLLAWPVQEYQAIDAEVVARTRGDDPYTIGVIEHPDPNDCWRWQIPYVAAHDVLCAWDAHPSTAPGGDNAGPQSELDGVLVQWAPYRELLAWAVYIVFVVGAVQYMTGVVKK